MYEAIPKSFRSRHIRQQYFPQFCSGYRYATTTVNFDLIWFLVRLEAIACWVGFCFAGIYFLFVLEISELHRPITAKFCMMLGSVFNFIISVLISVDFKLQWWISPEWLKIFKIGDLLDLPQFLQRLAKEFSELWSTNCGDFMWNHTHPSQLFRKTIFWALEGAPEFLHALENDQVLLAHPHRGQGSPLHF